MPNYNFLQSIFPACIASPPKLLIAYTYIIITGKLPININMEVVPQGLLSQSVEDLDFPPPIPPKMIWPNENDAFTSGIQNVVRISKQ